MKRILATEQIQLKNDTIKSGSMVYILNEVKSHITGLAPDTFLSVPFLQYVIGQYRKNKKEPVKKSLLNHSNAKLLIQKNKLNQNMIVDALKKQNALIDKYGRFFANISKFQNQQLKTKLIYLAGTIILMDLINTKKITSSATKVQEIYKIPVVVFKEVLNSATREKYESDLKEFIDLYSGEQKASAFNEADIPMLVKYIAKANIHNIVLSPYLDEKNKEVEKTGLGTMYPSVFGEIRKSTRYDKMSYFSNRINVKYPVIIGYNDSQQKQLKKVGILNKLINKGFKKGNKLDFTQNKRQTTKPKTNTPQETKNTPTETTKNAPVETKNASVNKNMQRSTMIADNKALARKLK